MADDTSAMANALAHPSHWQPAWRHAGWTVLGNTGIALALTVSTREGFWVNWVYSQCIGLAIWALIDLGRYALNHQGWPGPWRMSALVLAGTLAGYALGSAVGSFLLGRPLGSLMRLPEGTGGFLLLSLAAAGAATFVFTQRGLLAHARLEQAQAQQQASEAQLRLLESQLEPHMLFNTLANLRALIATDPPRAIDMLDRLNAYLRATLAASRADAQAHTLAREFERLDDYLALMAVRMGPRLRYRLNLPPELAAHPLPPLLLQPLVENAIRHGLEPAVAGGEIEVGAAQEGGALRLNVRDSGVGHDGPPQAGFGLTQVRERLQTAYGNAAQLDWRSAAGHGSQATLTLPLQTPATPRP